MNNGLTKVAIRQKAFLIPAAWQSDAAVQEINQTTIMLVANCNKLGFMFSEKLLQRINGISSKHKVEVLESLKAVTNTKKNWTPLVKQWNIPTGESLTDHIATLFANIFKSKGTILQCGHIIPVNTFPLDRYNGCPFCGTPFEFAKLRLGGNHQNTHIVLDLWEESDLKTYFKSLLTSPTSLDATQVNSLKRLLYGLGLPSVEIKMKETTVLVIDALVKYGKYQEAAKLFKNPADVLRYLWYKHTGFLQIVEPKTIQKRRQSNAEHIHPLREDSKARQKATNELKLKFGRKECKIYAYWLNSLALDVKKQCEIMHPKRGLWVRVIRALRLAEYSKQPRFENLKKLMDVFYNENYEVWEGELSSFKKNNNSQKSLKMLKQRPGLFARSLFSSILSFGLDEVMEHFEEVVDKIPSRLVFTLAMYADNYFDKEGCRVVKALGGINKRIPKNPLLQLYSKSELERIKKSIISLGAKVTEKRFSMEKSDSNSIYIQKELFDIPLSIGDRSESIQDLPEVLMGTTFPLEGDSVRLFLQWGYGLPAQHLDMDLSCVVAYEDRVDYCSYSKLVTAGCKHSGDIQQIPNKVGTAEYIDVNIDELEKVGAKYVSFTCNAYTLGGLSANLSVGWMNSKYPMTISRKGVAYNPAQVQHQIRIKQELTKGLVFGVLDIKERQVIWLELAFGGPIAQRLDVKSIEAFVEKLKAKIKIGTLLEIKAKVQNLKVVEKSEDADEVFDLQWALDSAKVSEYFLA